MKKIFTFAIILAAATMVSCGGNTGKTAEAAEAEAVVETTCEQVDSCACCEQADSCAVANEVVATEAEVK